MKKYLKQLDKNSLTWALIVTLIIPYFQKFDFSASKDSSILGFPFGFLTVREKLLGNSFLDTFSFDIIGFILSTIVFFIAIKLIKYFFFKKMNTNYKE